MKTSPKGWQKLIDEFGDLAAKVKRFEELKQIIRDRADAELPADQPGMYQGSRHAVAVSARGNRRKLKPGAIEIIVNLLGRLKAFGLFKVNLEDAEKALEPSDFRELVIEEKGVSARSVQPMPLAQPVSLKKAA